MNFVCSGNVDSSYKLVNHVILGEQRGAGVKTVARTIWDSANDAIASMSYENVRSLFHLIILFTILKYSYELSLFNQYRFCFRNHCFVLRLFLVYIFIDVGISFVCVPIF